MEDQKLFGAVLRMMRLERNWSQEQLCSGICTVSYLSKIEQGRVHPNPDLAEKLFLKLDIPLQITFNQDLENLCNQLYEMVFSDDTEGIESSKSQGLLRQESMALNAHYLDYLVLRAYCCRDISLLPEDLRPFLMSKQQCLLKLLSEEAEDAMRIYPCALTAQRAGIQAYKAGNYTYAIQTLEQAYRSASIEGYAKIMAYSQFYIGNCHLETRNIQNMRKSYTIAKRLAVAIQDERLVKTIDYNTASAAAEHGDYEEAYTYFSNIEDLTVLDAHKLAICCEKTGRRVEALAMLSAVQEKATGVQKDMCDLVRYRLKNKDYLDHPEYGTLLIQTFRNIRSTMPIGFARFHLPWVEEWCIANRQYKVIYEILKSFPK